MSSCDPDTQPPSPHSPVVCVASPTGKVFRKPELTHEWEDGRISTERLRCETGGLIGTRGREMDRFQPLHLLIHFRTATGEAP